MGLHVGASARYFYNGEPLVNGYVTVYEAGTSSTLKPIYGDRDETVSVANPARTNENGEITIFWSGLAKVVVTTSGFVPVAEFDNVASLEAAGGGGDPDAPFNVWRTYNGAPKDSPPPIPTGDGTSDGWQRTAFTGANWASEKNTQLVTDGSWSAPFLIAGIDGVGVDGDSPVVGGLTNEAHTYAADSDGVVADLSTGNGFFRVYLGRTEVSDQATFSVVSQTDCKVVINAAGAYSVTEMTADEASAEFQAVAFGVTVTATLSLAKSRSGVPGDGGANASLLRLTATSQQFLYDNSDGTPTPVPVDQTITFQVSRQNITGSVTWSTDPTVALTINGDLATLTVAAFGALQSTRVTATADGLSDFITISRLQSGQDGVDGVTPLVGYLTNENHTYPADQQGNVADFGPGGGSFKVFLGQTEVTDEADFSVVSQVGCSVAINSAGVYTVSGMSADQGTAEFRAVVAGTPVEKTLTLSRSRAGSDGDGLSAKTVDLNATALTFTYDNSTGTPTPSPAAQTITLIANRQNITDPIVWTTAPTVAINASGDTASLTVAEFGALDSVRITATADGLSDFVTITRIQGGVDGRDGEMSIIGYLTNESHTYPTDASGTVDNFAPGGGTFKVFEGTTDVTDLSAFAVTFETGCDVTISGVGVYVVNSMSSDQAVAGFRATYDGVPVDRVLTLSKARSNQSIALSATSETFRYDGSTGTDVADPPSQTITFTATRQNISNPVVWSSIPTVALSTNGDTANLTIGSFGSRDQVRVIATAGGFVDAKTVVRISSGTNGQDGSDGSDGINAYLTNENVTVNTDENFDGDLGPASGQMRVTEGATDVTGQSVFNVQSQSGGVFQIDAQGNYQLNSLSAAQASAELRATYAGLPIDKIFSVSAMVTNTATTSVSPNTGNFNIANGTNVIVRNFFLDFANLVGPVTYSWTLTTTFGSGLSISGAADQASVQVVSTGTDEGKAFTLTCDITTGNGPLTAQSNSFFVQQGAPV